MKTPTFFLKNWMIVAALTLAMAALALMEWYPLQILEYKTYDLRQRLRQHKPVSPVVIVAIDDQSIQKLGRWPWPRAYMAELIDVISEGKPALIATSILYTEPDRNSGLDEVRTVRKKIEESGAVGGRLAEVHGALVQAEKRLDNDAFLAESITRAGNVVLPLYFTPGERADASLALSGPLKKNARPAQSDVNFPTAIEQTLPIPPFLEGAFGLGHLNLFGDKDGAMRRDALFVRYDGYLFPSFALQTTLKYLKKGVTDVSLEPGRVSFGGASVPIDSKGRMLIDYCGGFGTFPYYSFVDVVTGRYAAETFHNRIVLIGPIATGVAGFEVTPPQPMFPGIEITANAVDSLLSSSFISRPAWALYAELGLMLLLGGFLAFVMPRFKAGTGAVISLGLLVGWNAVCVWLFVSRGEWLAMVAPSLLLVAGYLLTVSRRFMATEKSKELVESDSIETSKMLGLSFQGQGLLDLAFEKFRKCPLQDDTVRDLLYNLGLDFERKRMFNKAAAVYEHILTAGDYKDIRERIATMKAAGETMIFGGAGARKEATVLLQGGGAAGPTIGRFEIQKELGRGAMGTVFLGRDPKINRMVAIKTIRFDEIEAEQMDEAKGRFFREAEAAGALNHPNIVTIYDVGEDYDLAYVAMELLDGSDLSGLTRPENRLAFSEVLRIVGAVAEGLDFAWSKGIVHRDIKPANIMLLKNGDIKIADFGIARITATSTTKTGMVLGTPSYMSPEQVVGQKVDGRSDLFSLGVVMYELLSCHKPFTGDSITTIMYNIANKPPQLLTKLDPSIPECCAYIAHRLLIKDVAKRYQSGREVAEHVRICMGKLQNR
ncbi:MAG TPA: serine/threonine-protein kinase [Deltaproteobacteria bacterium]|nr:serine/threonine-protein kinase [Deltaproteobacteria bacterium]